MTITLIILAFIIGTIFGADVMGRYTHQITFHGCPREKKGYDCNAYSNRLCDHTHIANIEAILTIEKNLEANRQLFKGKNES